MNCRLCNTPATSIFTTTVLTKYEVTYYECPTCELVQPENPYWLEEAYSSPFTIGDTGTVRRPLIMGRSVATLLFFCFDRKGRFVDYAGGYGTLARYMRDVGFDYYTTDLYAPNIMARGFDAEAGRYELATAFECFEHFVAPADELERILAYSDSIFFSTEICPSPAPPLSEWPYYGFHHGQHIALYRRATLRFLAKKYGLHYHSLFYYHFFTRRKIPSFLFQFLVAAGRFGLNFVVRFFMKTRTFTDAELLVKRSMGERV